MEKMLELLNKNARISNKQLAVMLGTTEADVEARIAEYEKNGVINGYQALIGWYSVDKEYVIALIEVKVTPQRDFGFDELAGKIMNYSEVDSLYLMSGGYDLFVTISGHSFKEVAMFVSKRLSTLDGVTSTATHFVLKKYKDNGVILHKNDPDERGNASL